MYLAIDTSGFGTSVALFKIINKAAVLLASMDSQGYLSCKHNVVAAQESSKEQQGSHSNSLAAMTGELFAKTGQQLNNLQGIILGAGPGSFTGLRIGFSFAKGLALSLGVKLASVSTLRAIAYSQRNLSSRILAIDDARRGQFFVAGFSCGAEFQTELEEQIVEKEFIVNCCDKNSDYLLVSPQKLDFNQVTVVHNLAEKAGQYFLSLTSDQGSSALDQIADIKPLYIRNVSALSIADRKQLAGRSAENQVLCNSLNRR